jgi:hypothetical protein
LTTWSTFDDELGVALDFRQSGLHSAQPVGHSQWLPAGRREVH